MHMQTCTQKKQKKFAPSGVLSPSLTVLALDIEEIIAIFAPP